MCDLWFVIADRILIGSGYFISSATACYRPAHAVEMYGFLSDLQSMNSLFSTNNDFTKIELAMSSNCLGVIHKLEIEKSSKHEH